MTTLRCVSDAGPDGDVSFDLFICSIGYESRAAFVAKTKKDKYRRGFAVAFQDRQVLKFKENYDWCSNAGFRIEPFENPDRLTDALADEIRQIPGKSDGELIRLLVDVSSMSRPMIAWTIRSLAQCAVQQPYSAAFVYAPSRFLDLGNNIHMTSYIGPVSRNYAGWQPDVEARTTAIVGLGGERGVALGVVEHLEVTDAWVFRPTGIDGRFDTGAVDANRELIERIGASRVVEYDVAQAFECFCALESLVFGTLASERVVVVPLGPKIFSVVALLVAELYWPKVPVWRASSDQDGAPLDREADGNLVWLQAEFGPNPDANAVTHR